MSVTALRPAPEPDVADLLNDAMLRLRQAKAVADLMAHITDPEELGCHTIHVAMYVISDNIERAEELLGPVFPKPNEKETQT